MNPAFEFLDSLSPMGTTVLTVGLFALVLIVLPLPFLFRRKAHPEFDSDLPLPPGEPADPDEIAAANPPDQLTNLFSRRLNYDPLAEMSLRGVAAMGLPKATADQAAPDPQLVDQLLEELRADLAADRLTLPPFPENAAEIRRVVKDGNSTNNEVTAVIQRDPALGARVLKLANSALYTGYEPVADLHTAISRLGRNSVEALVVSALVGQLFHKVHSALINRQLKQLWVHSREVAAVAEKLARRAPHLDPQVALLAGLIHEIGSVPVLMHLDHQPELHADPESMRRVIEELSPLVGKTMLESWHFPPNLVEVVADYDRLNRYNETGADYTDVVLVAKLVCLVGQDRWQEHAHLIQTPALMRLGLSMDKTYSVLGDSAEAIIRMRDGLGQ